MNTASFWLAATFLLTAVLWVPYILNMILVRGLVGAVGYDNDTPMAPWAQRAKSAHANAIENIALFAPLVLAHLVAGTDTAAFVLATQVYFFARVVHYVVVVARIPWVRTLSFATGWAANMYLAVTLFSALN